MQTQTINVAQSIGPVCVSPTDGSRLCHMVKPLLDAGDRVVLDFGGVTTVITQFLNASVGCLHYTYAADDLRDRLQAEGLDECDLAIFELVRESAARYFGTDDATREVIDDVSIEMAEAL